MNARQSWSLLWQFVLLDLKVRYKNSILGIFWAVLKPFLLFTIYYVVFSFFLKVQTEAYALFLLVGIILWNFVAEGTTAGMVSLQTKANLVKKVYFPRIVVVGAACVHALIMLGLNLFIFLLFLGFTRGFSLGYGIVAFFLVLWLFGLVLGIALVLSVLFVKVRDVGHVWEIFLQVWFWVSPVVYAESFVPARVRGLYFLNPLAGILHSVRLLLLEKTMPEYTLLAGTIFMILVLLAFGYWMFQKYVEAVVEKL